MKSQADYRTLKAAASSEFTVQKSRFIGQVFPCTTEEEAALLLAGVRRAHPDARHNCYACILGKGKEIMRSSDDGEPGGTGGRPILQVMEHLDVTDCLCVVTRYFGGILLGTGGLTRAYSQGARDAFAKAEIVEIYRSDIYLLECSYSLWQRLDYFFKTAGARILSREFGTSVVVTLMVKSHETEGLLDQIRRISEGQAELMYDHSEYLPWLWSETEA